jgi:ribosome recycling factor
MLDQNKLKSDLDRVIAELQQYLSQLRTGRPNPAVFETIQVQAYGASMDIKSLASIAVDGLSIIISPFDKGVVKDIVKAINEADLGYNPVDEGNKIRINVPPLTEEIRKKVVAQMKIELEENYRANIREIRKTYMQKLDRVEGVSEDQVKAAEKQLQKMIDDAIAKVNELGKNKETEIMTIK